jgi:hypothetical protein
MIRDHKAEEHIEKADLIYTSSNNLIVSNADKI